MVILYPSYDIILRHLGPEHTGHFVQPHLAAHCGGDIYSRRKPLFSSFGEHTAVCGSSVPQAVARPRHSLWRGHLWLNKVGSVHTATCG